MGLRGTSGGTDPHAVGDAVADGAGGAAAATSGGVSGPGAHAAAGPGPDTGPVARHLLPDTAAIGPGGGLSVGGVDLCDLADDLGTPLFVYDEAHLRSRCRQAVDAWGRGVAYATKAFLCKAMARLAYDEGMCLDVSTGGELHVALSAGVPAERLVMHGNNKSEAEMERALAAGVGRMVVDSFDEIDRLERLTAGRAGRTGGHRQPVLVRVTPGVEAHTHEFVRTGQDDSKFGFGLASGAAAAAVDRLRRLPGVELVGVHAHIGSQVFRIGSFADAVEVLAGFFVPLDLPELCVGGGLGVAYVGSEEAPTMGEWAVTVRDECARAGVPGATRVTAEPGRSVVATAGLTLYRVGTVKVVPGIRTFVAVDGGMSDNPRPVLYGSGYEAFLPRAAGAERRRAVRLVGKHCESGDVLVADARVPDDLAVGDVVATPVTGAYGYSMASNYNKVPRPAVVFVSGGRARVVVRRETDDDLTRLDS
ncbi:MAG: diaminopimelate decarboxylase [Actinomycetota bacterium]|nr:diaminopimelate decarboxylase [Actinomycetota bacterium]